MATRKLVLMERTQTGDGGTFHAGLAYDPKDQTDAGRAALARYVARGFAREGTAKALGVDGPAEA
jgi:hypothetical protein